MLPGLLFAASPAYFNRNGPQRIKWSRLRRDHGTSEEVAQDAFHHGTSTTGAEAGADSACPARPWKGRSSTSVHAFLVFAES